jgi:hypothetical protein
LAGRVYGGDMKTLRQVFVTLFGSPFFWIGAAGALISFSTYFLLWSGHLNWLAKLIDSLGFSTYAGPFFALIFLASVFLGAAGFVMGVIHLCRKSGEKLAREHGFHLFIDPKQGE